MKLPTYNVRYEFMFPKIEELILGTLEVKCRIYEWVKEYFCLREIQRGPKWVTKDLAFS